MWLTVTRLNFGPTVTAVHNNETTAEKRLLDATNPSNITFTFYTHPGTVQKGNGSLITLSLGVMLALLSTLLF